MRELIKADFFRRIYKVFLLPPALCAVFILRILRPFLLIRFGELFSNRIGNFATMTELYLLSRKAKKAPQNSFDILYNARPISNIQLKKMWGRALFILPFTNLVQVIIRVNRLLPGASLHEVEIREITDRDGLRRRFPAQLKFKAKEEEFARRQMRRIGIPEGSSFVCFHVRDEAYLNKLMPEVNWSYHNYRDASVGNYTLAAEELAKRGYYVVRMGAVVKESLNTENPRIIDYATKYRSDFMDIYLSAKCKFFIGSNAGIDEMPKLFRRPVLYVNFLPLDSAAVLNSANLFIPKKLYSNKLGRLLNFKEILESGAGKLAYSEEYEREGIIPVENAPEEIASAAIEMEERLKGKWQPAQEDEELQHRFWSLFKPGDLRVKITCRIGAMFLRQNRQLLSGEPKVNEDVVSYT